MDRWGIAGLFVSMRIKTIVLASFIFCCSAIGPGMAQDTPLPSQKPALVDMPEKRSEDRYQREEHKADDTGRAESQTSKLSNGEVETPAPPVPERAPPPSRRKPKIAAQKYGPPAPPDNWNEKLISDAKKECERLISEKDYEFEALEPFKDGVCGAPAPIVIKALNFASKVEIVPAPTITCPLADAVRRWIADVVQPRAKALLEDEIVSLTNVASYHCRTRYNDPAQRMSQHAFANALDISEFMTAKGERISLIEHWNANDARSKFLKEIHDSACKFFGTVLGPNANAAHKSHFHLDMAKRRFQSYCQ